MSEKSRWGDIFKHLQDEGFEVYSPGIKVGDCLSKYVVVKHDGSSRRIGISTNEDFYSVLCYVPKQNYSDLEHFVLSVKTSMKKLEPLIFPRGEETPSFYDDTFNAHMIGIVYKNYKKML
jgi:hypothetical protein